MLPSWRPRLAALLLLAAVMATPAAMAEPGTLAVDVRLPVRVEGHASATADDAAFLLSAGPGPGGAKVGLQAGSLDIVTHRTYGAYQSYSNQSEVVVHADPETETLALVDATLDLVDLRPGFQMFATASRLTVDANASTQPIGVDVLARRLGVSYGVDDLHPEAIPINSPAAGTTFAASVPPQRFQMVAGLGTLRTDEPATVFLHDAEVRLGPQETRTIQAVRRVEVAPGSIYDPATDAWFGPGTHEELVQQYVVLRTQGRLQVEFEDLAGQLFAEAPVLDIQGLVTLPLAKGQVDVGDPVAKAIDNRTLTVAGDFRLAPSRPGEGRAFVEGAGDFRLVTYGVTKQVYDWQPVAVLTVAGLAALALAFAAKHAWPVLVAGYARRTGPAVLEHPARSVLHACIQARPGIDAPALLGEVAVSKTVLRYHLRVLEANGLVVATRRGRVMRYFEATTPPEERARLALLGNPTTAALVRLVARHPGLAQATVAARLGMRPPSALWHIRRAQEAQLIRAQRDGRVVRYYAVDDKA